MSHPIFDITAKTALVTGSSRGIGKALAKGLLEAGCTVVLNGRDTTALQATGAELAAAFGDRVRTAAFDVTDSRAVAAGIARIEEEAGPIDILVNNTGVQHRSPLLEFTDEDWHRLLDTNLTSAFLVARALAPRMIERQAGKIINICSLMSDVGRPTTGNYAA
ncbi:MAG: SDR family NAD(P)-dependent oxidoreductase, partial [Streptomyces sp.]